MQRRVFRDPAGEPQANMELDQRIAQQVCMGLVPATLRIYQWLKPAVSLGRRQSPSELPEELLALPWVRRPTGGGAVVHRMEELTYALALPRTAAQRHRPLSELPGRLHQHLRLLLVEQAGLSSGDLGIAEDDCAGPCTLCFSAPVHGDLLYRCAKVGGTALRVWRDGILVQGSIQGLPVSFGLLSDLLVRATGGLA